MTTLTITTKGQVTLRKDVLAHLGLRPGDKLVIDKLPDGRITASAERRKGKISDVFGMLKQDGQRTVSIEEMGLIGPENWEGKR